MSEVSNNTGIFRFGVFELDSRTLVLRKDGRAEPRLREQALQVLLALLDRPGEVISREEIQRRLWPADTFVDFDHGLNTAINQLRNALGDSAANPRFIETLPRRGYRFIAPVEVTNQLPVAKGPSVPTSDFSGIGQDLTASNSEDNDTLQAKLGTILSEPQELPRVPRGTVRLLFSLIQVMYLSFYVVSLARLSRVEEILAESGNPASLILIVLIVTAVVGIPVRLYLLAASIFNYQGLNKKFQKLFPFIFPLDELWSLAPFLIARQVGFGLAIAMTATLLYVPFAQRSLLHMGFFVERKSG